MTPEVAFHTGVDDKLGYTCRLLRKAYRQGARVAVTGAPELLRQLDLALWSFEPQEFVPHLRLPAGRGAASAQRRTPIWLVDAGADAPDCSVLVNLGPEPTAPDQALARLIEVVSTQADDAAAARRRWKLYEARGWPITHHAQARG